MNKTITWTVAAEWDYIDCETCGGQIEELVIDYDTGGTFCASYSSGCYGGKSADDLTLEEVDKFINDMPDGYLKRGTQVRLLADLADVLAVEMPGIEDEPRIEALAKALHCEHDVRVTGGEEA